MIPCVPCRFGCVQSFWASAALGVFPREKRALARFSRIYVTLICGIIYPLYIIYYYISVRTDLCARRISHFILRTRFLRCGFVAHSRFARRICLKLNPLLVFIGVRTLVRRTGSGVKIKRVCCEVSWLFSSPLPKQFPLGTFHFSQLPLLRISQGKIRNLPPWLPLWHEKRMTS